MPQSIPQSYVGKPAVIIGTGPSLDPNRDLRKLWKIGSPYFVKVGVNDVFKYMPLDVHVTVNPEWWEYNVRTGYWSLLAEMAHGGRCWHSDAATSNLYGLRNFGWFDVEDPRGLSLHPDKINLGHSSGFAALNISYLMGCNPIYLLGHDMKYPSDYNAQRKDPGGKRHFFGEYAAPLQHWPSVKVGKRGELDGLIALYERVARQMDRGLMACGSGGNFLEIYNVTPGSALTCFPTMTLDEAIARHAIP